MKEIKLPPVSSGDIGKEVTFVNDTDEVIVIVPRTRDTVIEPDEKGNLRSRPMPDDESGDALSWDG